MSRVGLVMDGELQVFEAAHWAEISEDYPDAVTVEVPDGFPETVRWTGASFAPRPVVMLGRDIHDSLFTADEKAAAYTTNSAIPVVIALVAHFDKLIEIAGPFHQQGVEVLRLSGVLTAERAEEAAAGLPPGALYPAIQPED